ncbi:hypothetical protein ACWGIR_31630 [Streptomyces albidoflavus]
MHPEDINLLRKNPITGYIDRRKNSRTRFADAGHVVFVATPRGSELLLMPVTTHYTPRGRQQWLDAFNGEPPVRTVSSADALPEALAAWANEEDYTFERMRHAWQCAEVNTKSLCSPCRIVEVNPWHVDAVRNDPAGYVFAIGNERRPAYIGGGVVIASARRFTVAEGASFSGWIIEQGRDYSDPIGGKRAAVSQLKNIAYGLD